MTGLRQRGRSALAGWPLRSRLVVVVTALVALGLTVAGFAAVAALRGYLLDEVDRGLIEVTNRLDRSLPDLLPNGTNPGSNPGGAGPIRPGPTGQERTYVRFADDTGAVVDSPNQAQVDDPPALPVVTPSEVATDSAQQPYTVPSQSGDTRWRVLTVPLQDGSGTVTAALDVGGIDATVRRLAAIELAIGALTLLALGIAAWFLVRRSLRPLVDVEHAAAGIAAGDLTHRAPEGDPRTEVGSLSRSFNTMVDSLQGALSAQALSERAARQSEAAARASEARMRQFVADASHELRTPLTSVRGFAELYRIGAVAEGPALDDAMSRIEAESARMGVLVEDLLVLARMDQQRPLERRDVDLLELVTDAVAATRAAAPARTVHIEVDPNAPEPIVSGDALRLRQVVDNLLSNSVRYSPADQPVLLRLGWTRPDAADPSMPALAAQPPDTPAAAADATSGGWAVLEVVDRGPGLSHEQAQRVFERFYRADPARSREHGGAGLGLAIVAAITEAHGGIVDVLTAPGQGCTFRVRLPLAPDRQVPRRG